MRAPAKHVQSAMISTSKKPRPIIVPGPGLAIIADSTLIILVDAANCVQGPVLLGVARSMQSTPVEQQQEKGDLQLAMYYQWFEERVHDQHAGFGLQGRRFGN